ncbi:hypothetical protein Q0F98_23170 [Paenibacillus amylolyticus]|nr:hypothetical protein Q0F98_23170 [Paenibacillus amylolyticus]
MKKSALFLPLLILVLFLSACGSSSSTTGSANGDNTSSNASGTSTAETEKAVEGYVPTELTVQFVPSQNADTLEAKGNRWRSCLVTNWAFR